MKKSMLTLMAFIFLSLFCFSAATAQPIKIGGALPLTGIYSETAKWIKQGYEFWGLPRPCAFTNQTTEGRVELVWPKSIATTKLAYPRPDWSK